MDKVKKMLDTAREAKKTDGQEIQKSQFSSTLPYKAHDKANVEYVKRKMKKHGT